MTASPAHAVRLAPLVAALDEARTFGALDRAVVAIAHDSRAVRPGSAFVALRGARVDGHTFIAEAIAAGALAIVVDAAYAAANVPAGDVTTIVVPDTSRALSRLAAAFFAYPATSLRIVGITGTNGKTTTTHLVAHVLAAAGIAVGRIGTLGAAFGATTWPLANTTPLALELQALLAAMRDDGARAVAMEVSSHALALGRVADVDVAIGVLTNVTRDHLDFHASFEAYAAAKRSLFARVPEAVLNVGDAQGRYLAAALRDSGRAPLTYGLAPGADVRPTDIRARPDGTDFRVDGTPFALPLSGRFNVENALAALCVARLFGVADALCADALATFAGVPGRMERFTGDGIEAIVDYAHTPDALAAVLRAARETSARDLHVVFGCGGARDRGKRPEMGRIASELADRIVVTSDNPRDEDPRAIVDDVLAGIARDGRVVVELDRRTAIRRALRDARPGDVVVVAGKGHETYQIVGASRAHFDDREEVRAALAARGVRVS